MNHICLGDRYLSTAAAATARSRCSSLFETFWTFFEYLGYCGIFFLYLESYSALSPRRLCDYFDLSKLLINRIAIDYQLGNLLKISRARVSLQFDHFTGVLLAFSWQLTTSTPLPELFMLRYLRWQSLAIDRVMQPFRRVLMVMVWLLDVSLLVDIHLSATVGFSFQLVEGYWINWHVYDLIEFNWRTERALLRAID